MKIKIGREERYADFSFCFQGSGHVQILVADGFEVVVEFVDERDSCGDVEFDDILVRHAVEMFNQYVQACCHA